MIHFPAPPNAGIGTLLLLGALTLLGFLFAAVVCSAANSDDRDEP